MPIPQEKLDRLTELLVDQLLAEFEKAKADNTNVDPRRLAAAQKLLEAADARTIKPAERSVKKNKKSAVAESEVPATDDDDEEVILPRCYATKGSRDRMRQLPPSMLTDRDREILDSFAEADGVETLPSIAEPTKGT